MRSRAVAILFASVVFAVAAGIPARAFSPDSELVAPGHWMYDAIDYLSVEAGEANLAICPPASRFELRGYLESIPYDSLGEQGRALYRKALAWFGERTPVADMGVAAFDVRPVLSLSARYLGSDDAYFSFDRTSAFNETAPLVSIPMEISFSPYVTGYADFSVGEGYWASSFSDNYTNVPNNTSSFDINIPKTAWLSAGNSFCTAAIGRGSLSIGRTYSGSMMLSDSADRLDYATLAFFSPSLRYSMTPVELAPDKYAYYHTFSFRPLKSLAITLSEGATVNSTLDLRYLNPFMIFHNYAGWRDGSAYGREDGDDTSPVGTQLGAEVAFVPLKGLKVYGQFVMNQFQTSYELESSGAAALIPNALGGTLGVRYAVPFLGGYLAGTIEGVYANPWLYIMDNKAISWYWSRLENVAPSDYTGKAVEGWLGSPYGPDTIACVVNLRYEELDAIRVGFTYRFVCKGINADAFFADTDGAYYPPNDGEAQAVTPYGSARYQHLALLEASKYIAERLEVSGFLGYVVMTGAASGQSPTAGLAVTWNVR